MRQALSNQDTIALHRALYRLQGSSGSLGLREIERLCVNMGQHLEGGQLKGVEAHIEVVEQAVQRVRKVLNMSHAAKWFQAP